MLTARLQTLDFKILLLLVEAANFIRLKSSAALWGAAWKGKKKKKKEDAERIRHRSLLWP